MAEWANRPKSQPRRRWNVQEHSSLNNLKTIFAEDGCSTMQYNLGRQLLEENSESNPEANHVQGVYWLLQAAQQGHDEALELLTDCYQNRRGITNGNERDVRSCLAMSPAERAVRKAARELFNSLSNGGEYITTEQLEQKMREIYELQKRRRRPNEDFDAGQNGHISPSPIHYNARIENISNCDLITENRLVGAAISYSNGRLPNISAEPLLVSVPHPDSLNHIPCFHRLLFHPKMFFILLYHRFVHVFSTLSFDNLKHFQFILLLLFFVVDNSAMYIISIIYYLTLIIMLVTTFKMVRTKQQLIDFRIWSGMFLQYGRNDPNMNTEGPENLFLRKNMAPYWYFFGSFLVNLLLQPLLPNEMILHSEITVISFALILISMLAFMYSSVSHSFPDFLTLISFGFNVLAKYPYEMDNVVKTTWRFLDLKVPNFPSFVIGNGIEFCLNSRTLLYLTLPLFLIGLARRKNWHGTYQYLIPHCITLCWLQILVISSQCTTTFGLARSVLGLAGVLLFIPLFGVATLVIPILATTEWLHNLILGSEYSFETINPTTQLIVIVGLTTIAYVISCVMAANKQTERYVTFMHLAVCALSIVIVLLPYIKLQVKELLSSETHVYDAVGPKGSYYEEDQSNEFIGWETFYRNCYENVERNNVQMQLNCNQLDGTNVQWEGSFSHARIIKVHNPRVDFIKNYLPTFLSDLLLCYFGEKNNYRCGPFENCDGINSHLKCNVNKWNTYTYELDILMSSSGLLSKPAEIRLQADHIFGNFTRNLKYLDKIWYRGVLRSSNREHFMTLGTSYPLIDVIGIGCMSCNDGDLKPVRTYSTTTELYSKLQKGVKYLFSFLLL